MRSTGEIQEEIDSVNQERATLVTNQPAGWGDRYAELQEQVTELAREWMAAKQAEEQQ